LLFLAAVLGKLDSWAQWSRLIEQIPGPPLVGRFARFAVPASEVAIVALSLASPVAGLAAASLILACFAIAVSALARRLGGQECNCFGAIAPATISPRLAGRNAGLAVLAAGGWYAAHHANMQAQPAGNAVATVLVGVIVLMLVHYWRLRETALAVNELPTAKEIE
jgi:hypothetical protein